MSGRSHNQQENRRSLMPEQDNQKLADDLVKSLGLQHPPLAIHFSQDALPGIEPFTDEMPAPTEIAAKRLVVVVRKAEI